MSAQFLASARAIVLAAISVALTPPPPPDVATWAARNLEFDDGSPFPGPFDPSRFPMLARIHAVMSPDHPAREVTVRGSAQIGKTEAIIKALLGCIFAMAPRNTLVVHPTSTAAAEWVRTKWLPFRRACRALVAVFGAGSQLDGMFYQETVDRRCSLRTVSAGSPSELSGTTRPNVIMDDVSKFESTDMGDPESLAASRAEAFEDAKIVRVSTPMIAGACRITTAFQRGTAEEYRGPCPHCDHRQALKWENFRVEAEDPGLSHFICEGCGCEIHFKHREAMMAAGEWVATNPRGDHPSFHLWRAMMPFRDWRSLAVAWLQAQGDPGREQTFFNDVLGLPYEQASDAPDWEKLRARAEDGDAQVPLGRIPAGRPILVCGVDCQGDRIEWHLVAMGRENRAHSVDYGVIPHHVGTDEGRAGLDALLKRRWRNMAGRDLAIDRLGIDGGAYTDDVWDWVVTHPASRVVLTKGASSQNAPLYAFQKMDRKTDGRAKRRPRKQAYLVNVSALKATFYGDLKKDDPEARGFQSFAAGLADWFYRQLCSERRTLKRNRHGVMESRWDVVEKDGRNEALDTRIIADVMARLAGWRSMTDAEWDALEAERDSPPPEAQGDLFDPAAPLAAAPQAQPPAQTPAASSPPAAKSAAEDAFAALARRK